MPEIDPAAIAHRDRYRLLIGAVVPRPIAWLTTVDAQGRANLAPFSFFNGVTASPPIVSVAIAHRDPPKDTLANLQATGEAVLHLVPADRLADCHASGGEYAHAISEIALLGLATLPARRVRPPRLACADVALECRLHRIIPVGDPATHLCLLEVVHAHIADAVAGADGLPDPHRLAAVARLGDRCYLAAAGWTVVEQEAQRVPPELGVQRRPRE